MEQLHPSAASSSGGASQQPSHLTGAEIVDTDEVLRWGCWHAQSDVWFECSGGAMRVRQGQQA